jgi:enoyl-CoA hydratase
MTPVRYELRDAIATITMDDGKRNVLSLAMFDALTGALDRAAADRATVVLTGREGVFSAGFDLHTLGAGGDDASRMVRAGFELAERLLGFPMPVVVACTGHAIAMGAFLLLAGDHRLGAAGPFKIGATEVALGITMPFFGVEICRQRLAPPYFHRAVINAEVFGPDDAAAAGFVDRVVAADALADAARAVAVGLQRLDASVHAATKRRARSHALAAVRAAIEADAAAFATAP